MHRRTILLALGSILALTSITGCASIQGWLAPHVEPQEVQIEATDVIDSDVRNCDAGNEHCNPALTLGPPDGNYVSLGGREGFVAVRMSDAFVNGPGPDLRIYEIGDAQGDADEPFDVLISRDGSQWIQIAEGIRNDDGRSYASIEISPHAGDGTFRYVKVVDRNNALILTSDSPASDIDAVIALWAPRI